MAGAIAIAVALALTASGAVAQTTNQGPPPFASGTLASISGSTLQIEGANGSTNVVVTGSTSYQQTKASAASDIAVGDCVRAIGTGSATQGIDASTVAITKPSSKGCTPNAQGAGRFGGFRGGQRPNFPSGQRPNFPEGGPGGANGNGGSRPTNFGTAFGAVKHVSGDVLTVKALTISRGTSSKSKPKTKTQTVTVTLSSSTTITQTVAATVKDLTVGSCVSANGTTDSVGTITARRVNISQPRDGMCTGFGFGGRGRFGGQQTA